MANRRMGEKVIDSGRDNGESAYSLTGISEEENIQK